MFQKGMIFGAASASFQIEGAAREDGKGLSVWDVGSHQPGNVRFGHNGDAACDHYHRYAEDVALMAEIGLDAYRFSVAWPRVMPDGVTLNPKGLDFYDRLTDELLAKGITPYATLYHWDLPYELYLQGGWFSRDIADRFGAYADAVLRRLGDRIKHWIPLNEPQCFIGLGYQTGDHAPFLRCAQRDVLNAIHNVLRANGRASQVIRSFGADQRVGYAPTGSVNCPADESPANVEAARAAMFHTAHDRAVFTANWWADPIVFGRYPEDGVKHFGELMPDIRPGDMELIHQPPDFYGMNIYWGDRVRAGQDGKPEEVPYAPGGPRTALEWTITPEALYWGPRFIYERYKIPVVITENGMAGTDWIALDGGVHDPQRIDYLTRYLAELERAANDGVDVRGYFQWSLTDNFEWAYGYEKRFGLVYIDYETQKRTLKDSALWYRDFIRAHRP